MRNVIVILIVLALLVCGCEQPQQLKPFGIPHHKEWPEWEARFGKDYESIMAYNIWRTDQSSMYRDGEYEKIILSNVDRITKLEDRVCDCNDINTRLDKLEDMRNIVILPDPNVIRDGDIFAPLYYIPKTLSVELCDISAENYPVRRWEISKPHEWIMETKDPNVKKAKE